jgi:hypothetical protein
MNGLAALLLAVTLQEVAQNPEPQVKEIEIRGARAFDREAVLGLIRLHPGDSLRRTPELSSRMNSPGGRSSGSPLIMNTTLTATNPIMAKPQYLIIRKARTERGEKASLRPTYPNNLNAW